MNVNPTLAPRQPSADKLREKFHVLRASGVQDIKFWYVGPTGAGAAEGVTVDDLSAEALTIIEAYEKEEFVNISAKLK